MLHVSATAFGGGVSEILYTLVPLMRDVGLDCHWQVIMGREEFFNATKLLHNSLQGDPNTLTPNQWELFDHYNEMNAKSLRGRVGRGHRPRPAAGRDEARRRRSTASTGSGAATSTSPSPTRTRSSGCAPLISEYDASVWHMEQYVPAGLKGHGGDQHRPPGDRPALAEEHGLLARRRLLRLRPVRDRRRPAADDPGLALRPLEGPDRGDRRLPRGDQGGARGAARAGRLDGDRRPRGLGVLPAHLRVRRLRPRRQDPQQPQQRRRDRGQRLPVPVRRAAAEVDPRGLRADRRRGAVEGAADDRRRRRRHPAADRRRRERLPGLLARGGRAALDRDPQGPGARASRLGRAGKERARERFLTPRLLRDWLRMFTALESEAGDALA